MIRCSRCGVVFRLDEHTLDVPGMPFVKEWKKVDTS